MQCQSVPCYTALYIYILSNARTISWHAVLNCALLDCSILDDTCTIQYNKNITIVYYTAQCDSILYYTVLDLHICDFFRCLFQAVTKAVPVTSSLTVSPISAKLQPVCKAALNPAVL